MSFPTQYSGHEKQGKSAFEQLQELKERGEDEFFTDRLELALEREYITNEEYKELKWIKQTRRF